MPAENEISEEGIGFFRDVWTILDVSLSDAADVVADERVAATAVDAVATDPGSFERLAIVVEEHNPDFPSEDPADEASIELLARHADVHTVGLPGLEIGVAGLSYALAAIGCVPAASCRSHVGKHSWSDRPVVLAAIDRAHAEWLQPLVERSSCGFDIDNHRPDFLVIHARSISEMMDLATMILAVAENNPPPPLQLRPSSDDEEAPKRHLEVEGQQSLFD
jgi:hypothetical protein